MRFAAVVILYYPNEEVVSNILTYSNYVEKMFIFDNTDKEDFVFNLDLLDKKKVDYLKDGMNKGIAERLNLGAQKAIEEGFDWLLTMDQDSNFSETDILNYVTNVQNFENINNVALFGVNEHNNQQRNGPIAQTENVDTLITSGCLLNLSLFNTIGLFNESLFIDYVDYDYCIRSKINGLSLVKFQNILLNHQLGNYVFRASIKTLFLIKKHKEIHSPIRCYYIIRNILYLRNKYKNLEKEVIKTLYKDALNHLEKCILYGNNFFNYCYFIFKGVSDFRNGRMGKIKK